jgi:hypothetical protein
MLTPSGRVDSVMKHRVTTAACHEPAGESHRLSHPMGDDGGTVFVTFVIDE